MQDERTGSRFDTSLDKKRQKRNSKCLSKSKERAEKQEIKKIESIQDELRNQKPGRRCCKQCKQVLPMKCWRRMIKEDLYFKTEYTTCKWRKYLLLELQS